MRTERSFSPFILLLLLMFLSPFCPASEQPFHVEKNGDLLSLYSVDTGERLVDHAQHVVRMDGYWKFTREGRHGIIADDGRLITRTTYDEISRSLHSKTYIVARDNKYGVIDLDGRERVPLEYSRIFESWEPDTPWIIRQGDRVGLMDPGSQRLLMPVMYQDVVLHGAFALATGPENVDAPRYQAFTLKGQPVPGALSGEEIVVWGDDRLILETERILDADGRLITVSGAPTSIRPLGKMSASVFDKVLGTYGVIDRAGRWVVRPRWDYIDSLGGSSRGWMRVASGGLPQSGGEIGVIDLDGRIILQPRWDGVDLHGGDTDRPFFQVIRDGKIRFFDLNDSPLLPTSFDTAHLIDRETTFLVKSNGKTGLCTNIPMGYCPIPPEYDRLLGFDGAPDDLWIAQKDGRLGVLQQTDGSIVVPLEYDFLQVSSIPVALQVERSASHEMTIDARKSTRNGTLQLRRDERRNWRLVEVKLDTRPDDWRSRASLAACPALPAFEQRQANTELRALVQRWRTGLQEQQMAALGLPWPAFIDSVANRSRALQFVETLFLRPWQLLSQPRENDVYELDQVFTQLLETATAIRSGGRYPESEAQFAGLCAEVWYLRIPAMEESAEPLLAGGYALPAAGALERDVYPFITVTRTPDGLRLAGVSRELVQVLDWYYTNFPMSVPSSSKVD